MSQEHEIVQQVYDAKSSLDAADELILQYMPFIKSETSKFIKRAPIEGQDDELSIAMIAFHEAIQAYDQDKGSFVSLASTLIRNRLIDFWRSNKRHDDVISLETTVYSGDDSEQRLEDTLADDFDQEEAYTSREATQAEIEELSQQMLDFGVSLEDVAENCPKQERTLLACQSVIDAAKSNEDIMEDFLRSKRLPIKRIVDLSGVAKKTIERHRKYIVALLLIYSNGYEIIRGHLREMRRGGDD